MKRILSAFLLTLSLATQAGLPPTSSKISGESVHSTTFKTDFGFLKGTRSGSTLTLNSLGAAVGDSLALGSTLNANSIFDATSTTKGVLPPRMTTAQKLTLGSSLTTTDEGMIVYDTDIDALSSWNGTQWIAAVGSLVLDHEYSAKISSAGVVSAENTEWITGNCVTTSTSTQTCAVPSGIFTTLPNCGAFTQEDGRYNADFIAASSTITSLVFRTTDSNSQVAGARPLSIHCQKTGADYVSSTFFTAANANYTERPATSAIAGGGITFASAANCTHQRNGGNLTVKCGGTATTSAALGYFTLPDSLIIDTARIPHASTTSNPCYKVGTIKGNAATTYVSLVVCSSTSTTVVYTANTEASAAHLTPVNTSSAIATGQVVGVEFTVPISGWSNLSQVMAVIPNPATLSDVKASGTDGGSASATTTHTRTLNTIVDTSGIVTSLTANQFTLPAGTYYIEASAPGYGIKQHKARIRNITDSTTSLIGSSEYALDTASVYNRSVIKGEITITTAKTFELQHYGAVARATNGLGVAITTGESEVYSIVKITKLK